MQVYNINVLSSCTGVTEVALCFSSTLNCWCAIISRIQILLCIFQKEEIPNTSFSLWKDAHAIITKQRLVCHLKEKRLFESYSWVTGYLIFLSFAPSWGSRLLFFHSHPTPSLYLLSFSCHSLCFFHISWWNSEILNRLFWSIFLSSFGCFVCFSLQGKKETGMHDTKALKHAHTHTKHINKLWILGVTNSIFGFKHTEAMTGTFSASGDWEKWNIQQSKCKCNRNLLLGFLHNYRILNLLAVPADMRQKES